MLFSVDGTKLQRPTFPLARPTANDSSLHFRYDGATQRMYWYLVSDANRAAVDVFDISKWTDNNKRHNLTF